MIIVITGASRGIGKALAEIFAAAGHSLFLSSRDETLLTETSNELKTRYPAAQILSKAFDLSHKEETKELADWILDQRVIPDILVNNAGSFRPGNVHDEPEGSLEDQMCSNLYSAYHLTRALVPSMMREKDRPATGRHIFNMCSIASLKAYKNGGAYSISKFALYGFSKNLREEMMPFGIKVTAVLPGAVYTDSWAGFDNSEGRIMEAGDIAKLVFVASQLSPQACVEDIIIRPQLGDL